MEGMLMLSPEFPKEGKKIAGLRGWLWVDGKPGAKVRRCGRELSRQSHASHRAEKRATRGVNTPCMFSRVRSPG